MIRFITCFLLLFSINTYAAIQVNGSFQATQSCPAFLSKNSKSNPGNVMVQPNTYYPIREINKADPTWLRVVTSDAHYSLRWVSTSCGVMEYKERTTDLCDTHKGKADTNILALSSQTGFCENYGYEAGKPECLHLSKNSFEATHLTLHGLWPNQDSCGQHYGYCEVKPKPNHCDYTPLHLSTEVSTTLSKLMPSYHFGSCLERHEWSKHGSCQFLSDNDYFALALRLTKEVNNSSFGHYLTEHQGKTLPLSVVRKQIKEAFGEKNGAKIYLHCKNGLLIDVFITLPALIPMNEPLESLVNQAPNYYHNDACPAYITLSDFHKEAF
jgi:ribonuclease T2